MTLEREVHANLRTMLMANEPFEYAHLIKFERPSRPSSLNGEVSSSAVRYTHITDASRDIEFDDGSKTTTGVSNGVQTYIANKVIKVSEVSESVEAKATTFSLTVDGNGLGADIGASGNLIVTVIGGGIFDIEIVDKTIDPVAEGFREGDKIDFYGNLTGAFNIQNFRANNVVRVKKIDVDITAGTKTVTGFRLSSEEVKSILLDKNSAQYASFLNREVFIYKLYQQNGVTVGAPVLLFKGIISNVSFDDGDKGIAVTWGLTSHWGDFAQVKGRIASDDFHRALDQNGNPQPQSALKPEYAYDKGFIHSETSINTLAKYVVQVEKTKIKAKNGILGLGAKTKVKKYFVPEDRFTQLDIQLAAKAIPLHYGVRVTEGFPIFADTLKNDSSTVFIIYALGEGPIGGIYDIFIDGKSLICNDKNDLDTRSVQTAEDTVDIVCRGRADRGDVLEGGANTSGGALDYYAGNDLTSISTGSGGLYGNLIRRTTFRAYTPPTTIAAYTSTGKGVIDGETITLESPIDMTLDFFAGTEGQAAASQLVQISKDNGFKIQNDYWSGTDSAEYWGPNHRLQDTAYVLAKFKISEGETTLPGLEFIIRAKVINCYNYDYSYTHYAKAAGESSTNFALGSTVELRRSDTDAVINASVQIIDKWDVTRPNGVVETRFRFSTPPALNYVDGVPVITKFYMKSGANNWTMVTYNFVEHSGTIDTELTADVLATDVGGNYVITLPNTTFTGTTTAPAVYGVGTIPNIILAGQLNTLELQTVYRYVTLVEA